MKFFIKLYSLVIIQAFLFISSLSEVVAQVDLPNSPTDPVMGPSLFSDPSRLPTTIISVFLPPILTVLGFTTVLYIILAGNKFIRSSGDPKAAEEARGRLTFAIVGFVIIILALLLTQLVDRFILGETGAV
jgi:hypothetical protein